MTDLKTTICQITQDMYLNESRKDFLAKCTKDRIEIRNKLYEDQFDHYLSLLESNELSTKDIVRVGNSLRSISHLVTSSYDELIKMIEVYDKNLFNKD